MLKDHPNYSARELAEVIGITPKAIEKHLAKLKAEGLIKREGPDKGGSWTVLKAFSVWFFRYRTFWRTSGSWEDSRSCFLQLR